MTPSAETALPYAGIFERDGARIVPTELARGPWNPNALHGGPVAALAAVLVEGHEPDTLPPFVARITVELFRPVPLAPLVVETVTRRPGRKVAWVDASIRDSDGVEVAGARALRTHVLEPALDVGPAADPAVPSLPHPDDLKVDEIGVAETLGFWSANDFRVAGGHWMQAGPGAAWFRLRVPVVAGEPTSPLARTCAAADFGSGVGNPVRMSSTSTINPELTVHVHRAAASEWIGLESMAWAHGSGAGLCETRLFDTVGTIGRGCQSLLVQDFNPFPR